MKFVKKLTVLQAENNGSLPGFLSDILPGVTKIGEKSEKLVKNGLPRFFVRFFVPLTNGLTTRFVAPRPVNRFYFSLLLSKK